MSLEMELSDESLLAAHVNGDTSAFAELVQRHAGAILGYLRKMNGDYHTAEELCQETFIRIFHKAGEFRAGAAFKPWLYTIATNLAVDTLRRKTRRTKALFPGTNFRQEEMVTEAGNIPDKTPDASAVAVTNELKQQVRNAVESLPEHQKAAVVLSYFQGLSYNETADALGCSLST
ncbi:MAG: sigma-70 family RNA polymerase sigma factor, partial [Kiritimatiellia bacterium]|nr:sigma-70 family RNA polymerase sigma factor [Kiritimatiellia bacterium]